MTKAKLLSLCLAAVLLCGCIVGFMVIGANAAFPYTDYTVQWIVSDDGTESGGTDGKTFNSLQAAVEAAEEKTDWAETDVLSIQLNNGATGINSATPVHLIKVENDVLFGVQTIWRGTGDTRTKLPIYICGRYNTNNGYGTSNGSRVHIGLTTDGTTRNTSGSLRAACSNDYSFVGIEGVDFAGHLYAGCGNIAFFNSRFSSEVYYSLSADNFTESVYRGWTAADLANAKGESGKIKTSITFDSNGATANAPRCTINGKIYGVSYNPEGVTETTLNTITYEEDDTVVIDVKPCDTVTEINFEGCPRVSGTISMVGGSAPVAKTSINIDGYIDDLGGYYGSLIGVAKDVTAWADVEMNYAGEGMARTGSTYGQILLAENATMNGDLTVNVVKYANEQGLIANQTGATMNGNLAVNVTGGTIPSYTGIGALNVDGGAITTCAATDSVTLKSGTITNYTGSAVLNMSGGTVTNYSGSAAFTVGSGFALETYSGSGTLTVDGGTVTAYKGTGTLNLVSGDVTKFYYTGEGSFTVPEGYKFDTFYATSAAYTGNIVNNVTADSGTFSCTIAADGTRTNTINADYFNNFYGSSAKVTGNVTNNLTNVTLAGNFRGSGAGVTKNVENNLTNVTIGGTYYGTADSITGTVTNTLKGGEIGGTFAGCYKVSGDVTNHLTNVQLKDSDTSYFGGSPSNTNSTAKIENTLDGTTYVTGVYFGGHYRSKGHTGVIINNIKENVSLSAFYGGNYSSTAGGLTGPMYSQITNNISGGTFRAAFRGGWYGDNSTAAGGSVTNIVTGGLFEEQFRAGNYNVKDIENEISGGTFKKSVYLGSNGSLNETIVNTITGGSFPQNGNNNYRLYMGNVEGHVKSITSTVSTEIDKYIVYGGNAVGTVDTIENNLLAGASFINFYGGSESGTVTTSIANTIEGATFTASFRGGMQRGILGVATYAEDGETLASFVPATITNNIYSGTFETIYPDSNNYLHYTGSVYVEEGYEGVANTKFILNDEKSGDITISKSILDNAVAGGSTEIVAGDHKFVLGADSLISVDTITGNAKIHQTEGWTARNYIIYSGSEDLNGLITVTEEDGAYGDYVIEDGALKGKPVVMGGITLALTDRIAVQFLFDKTDLDALGKDKFAFNVALDGTALKVSALAEHPVYTNYYYVEVAGISPLDFDKKITYSGTFTYAADDIMNGEDGILGRAEDNWTDAVAKNLAKSLRALGDANYEYAPVIEESKSDTFSCTFGDDTTFVATDVGIVMGDAVGITIYGTGETSDLKVIVNGNEAPFTATADYIDIFVNIANARNDMKIEIRSAEGKTCFELTTSVEKAAARYPESHQRYVDVQKVLAYIQAADAYKAAQA